MTERQKRDLQITKKLPLQPFTFFLFKIPITVISMYCEKFGRFHRRKLKKNAVNLRLKAITLKEKIVEHHTIVAYLKGLSKLTRSENECETRFENKH